MGTIVTLKFCHGGHFKRDSLGVLSYIGRESKTFVVDADELCWWYLLELLNKCGTYNNVAKIYYHNGSQGFEEGLRGVYDDNEVREMGKFAVENRFVCLYVAHGKQELIPVFDSPPILTPTKSGPPQMTGQKNRKKLTPRRKNPAVVPLRKSPRNKQEAHAEDASPTALNDPTAPCTETTHLNLCPLFTEKEQSNPSSSVPQTQAKTPIVPENPIFSSQVIDEPILTQASQVQGGATCRSKTPKAREPSTHTTSSVPEDYDWIDPRPESPLSLRELGGIPSEPSSEEDDPEYILEDDDEEFDEDDDKEEFDEDDDVEVRLHDEEELENFDCEIEDDEFLAARERVRGCNDNLKKQASRLQKQVEDGKAFGSQIFVDEGDEDQKNTPPTSDEEDNLEGYSKRVQLVSRDTDFLTFQWQVGQRFSNMEDFKTAVSKFAILQGRNLSFVVSNSGRGQRVGVRCIEGCPFRLYSSWDTRRATFVVKSLVSEHKCTRNMERNKQLKSSWLAGQLLEVFKARPHWPAKDIQEAVKTRFRCNVKKNFAYKVKYYAHRMLHGSMKDHYHSLGRYVEAIKQSSPGSCVEVVTDPEKAVSPPVFQRFFMSFEGLQNGWKEGCRKVICVDACFLKTFLGGQLLSAVGRDGNDQMFPIAWAAAEGENNNSWEWFFLHLQSCLQLGDGTNIVVISDEHQSILNAVTTVLPKAEHRHCARHIFVLWHKDFKGDEMKLHFWNIAHSYNMADYNDAVAELEEVNKSVADSFQSYNPKLFCRAFLSSRCKSDAITSNLAETFNGYIINARTKHLIYMLEDIRAMLMQRLVEKKQEIEKWKSDICPKVVLKLEENKEKAAQCSVIPSSRTVFQVNHNLDSLTVDLDGRTCTCRKWNMTGYPCCHGVAAIFFCHLNAEDFVDDCFKKEAYLKAYSGSIPPIEGMRHWPRVDLKIDPPPIKVGSGRPRKKRRKGPHETNKSSGKLSKHGIEMTCARCKRKGHNKRRCTNSPVAQEPQVKRPRGRPKSATVSSTFAAPQANNNHTTTTAEPSRTGRGGRVICTRRGGRGGGALGGRSGGSGDNVGGSGGRGRGRTQGTSSEGGRGRGRGRGRSRGKGRGPIGVGKLFAEDGSIMAQS